MGKRIIISGVNYQDVSVSNEPILALKKIYAMCPGGQFMTNSQAPLIPEEGSALISSSGNFVKKINGSLLVEQIDPKYNGIELNGIVFSKVSNRWDVIFPTNLEVIQFLSGNAYLYNPNQSAEPQITPSSASCAKIILNKNDLIILNIDGGESARAIWVMNRSFTERLAVTDANALSTSSPICYIATSDCVCFINRIATRGNSYVVRA